MITSCALGSECVAAQNDEVTFLVFWILANFCKWLQHFGLPHIYSSVQPKELFYFRQKPKLGRIKSPKPNRNRTFCRSRQFLPNQAISAENGWFCRISASFCRMSGSFCQIFGSFSKIFQFWQRYFLSKRHISFQKFKIMVAEREIFGRNSQFLPKMTDSAETIWFGRISRFGTLGKKISAETERVFGRNFRQKYCRNDVRSHTNLSWCLIHAICT